MAAADSTKPLPVYTLKPTMDSLDFLPPLESGLAARDTGTILIINHDIEGPYRISGLSLPRLEELCPVLAAAFDVRRHGAIHGMESVSFDAVASLLRFIYTKTYLPLVPSRTIEASLLTQMEVIKLAQIYAVEELEQVACKWIKKRLAFGRQDQTRPAALIEGIRYAYKHFKCDGPVMEALLNYCICNLIHHDLVADQDFVALFQTIPYFHQDLCTISMHSSQHATEAQLLIRIDSDLQRQRNVSRSPEEIKKMTLMATIMFSGPNRLSRMGPYKVHHPRANPYGPAPSMHEHAAQLQEHLIPVWEDRTRGEINSITDEAQRDSSPALSTSGLSTSVDTSQLPISGNPPPYTKDKLREQLDDSALKLRNLRNQVVQTDKLVSQSATAPLRAGERVESIIHPMNMAQGASGDSASLKDRIKRARLDYIQQKKLVGDHTDDKVLEIEEGEFMTTELEGRLLKKKALRGAGQTTLAGDSFRFDTRRDEQGQNSIPKIDEKYRAYVANAQLTRDMLKAQNPARKPSYATRSAGPLPSRAPAGPGITFQFGQPLSPPPDKPLPQPLAALAIRAKSSTPPGEAKVEKDDWHKIDLASPALSDSNAAEEDWTMVSGPATASAAPAAEADYDWVICDDAK